MQQAVTSKSGVTIRLTDERWAHITEEHSELAGMRYDVLESVAEPDRIYRGGEGEAIAAKEIEAGKFLVVIYRELDSDGFIITAFMTRRIKSIESRELLWSVRK